MRVLFKTNALIQYTYIFDVNQNNIYANFEIVKHDKREQKQTHTPTGQTEKSNIKK